MSFSFFFFYFFILQNSTTTTRWYQTRRELRRVWLTLSLFPTFHTIDVVVVSFATRARALFGKTLNGRACSSNYNVVMFLETQCFHGRVQLDCWFELGLSCKKSSISSSPQLFFCRRVEREETTKTSLPFPFCQLTSPQIHEIHSRTMSHFILSRSAFHGTLWGLETSLTANFWQSLFFSMYYA